MRLRHYLDEGYSQTVIAELLGMSRRTIYRWIKSGELDRDPEEPPRYGKRPQRPRIQYSWLEDGDGLTAPGGLTPAQLTIIPNPPTEKRS